MPEVAEHTDLIEQLETRLATQKAELRDLATMGAVITSIHDINAILSVVMDMAVRQVKGEVGIILLEENSELVSKASWGVSESFVRSLKHDQDMDLPAYCHQKRETVILNDLGIKNEHGLLVESALCVPIKTSARCHGVITVINKENGSKFTNSDKEVLEMLLSFVAVAIDNSNLLKDKLERQKIEQEMAIARQIQKTILPHDIDDIEGVEIGVEYYPAREVGGDFYDIIRLSGHQFVVVVGDVSNKGVPAALVMSAAAGIIKSILKSQPNIEMSELVATLNDTLAQGIIKDREMFVTLFFCKFDLDSKVLTYCNAGHMPGLFWEPDSQKVIKLSDGGPLVGQFMGTVYKQGERSLPPHCRLFLFTDGLTEAADSDDHLFGSVRTEELFRSEVTLAPKVFCQRVKRIIDDFRVGCSEESMDDFTIMQIKVD